MPYDPMQGFQIGQQIGKSKRSAYGNTSDYMSDLFKTRDAEEQKTNPLELAILKSTLQNPLQKAQTDLTEAKTGWLNNTTQAGGAPEGMVLDRITPNGPSYVNNQARADLAGQKKYSQNKATIDPLVQSGENVLKTSVGAFKQMIANNPAGAGRAGGLMNWIGGKLGTNPAVNAYNGLKVETATELAKIANPSGRGGPEIAKEFEKLLPNDFSTWEEFSNKFHYAAQNAFARQAAYNNIPYNPDDYESKIQEILNTPAFHQMEVGNKSGNPLMNGISNSNTTTPNGEEDSVFQNLKAKYGGRPANSR